MACVSSSYKFTYIKISYMGEIFRHAVFHAICRFNETFRSSFHEKSKRLLQNGMKISLLVNHVKYRISQRCFDDLLFYIFIDVPTSYTCKRIIIILFELKI